jgi:hypothetical protein
MTGPDPTVVRAARARLHQWVCRGQWNPDCQRPGGQHERKTWPLTQVRYLLADGTGSRLHALMCPLALDQTKTCPRPGEHAQALYAALTAPTEP